MKSVVKTIPATQAREQLADLMNKTYFHAEGFVLERRGIPMSVLIGIREYERLLAGYSERSALADAQPVVEDPLAAFAGAVESGIPDLAARHDDYLGRALTRDLQGGQNA